MNWLKRLFNKKAQKINVPAYGKSPLITASKPIEDMLAADFERKRLFSQRGEPVDFTNPFPRPNGYANRF